MIAIVAVPADENDAAVAERSVGLPLRACSVAVVVAVERPRRLRRPLAWMRSDVEKSDDDVEDRGQGHSRWVDFLIALSYELLSPETRKGTSPCGDPSAIHPGADAVASGHAGCRPSCPSPSCASLPACARTVCCPFLVLFDVKKINGGTPRMSIDHRWIICRPNHDHHRSLP